ncbi:Glyco-tran-10-N domain-containing protein [Aphelenchoides besseyi]|nr:Glyco-tran-10-N domain-containing protein [Aphelenchoides besseyi]
MSVDETTLCNLIRYGALWKRVFLLLILGFTLNLVVLIVKNLLGHEVSKGGQFFGLPFAKTSFMTNVDKAAIQLLKDDDIHPTEATTVEIFEKLQAGIPLVVHWTPFFHENHIREFIRHFPNCEFECVHTEDRQFLSQARAIIFHARHTNLSDLPPDNPNQLRVLFTREGPNQSFFLNGQPQQLRPNYFNATITYRTNSDVYLPYATLRELDGTESEADIWTDEQIDERIAKKSKLALIAVSHCDTWSKREIYTRALQHHMKVTSIGRCNKNTDCLSKECLSKLEEEHFFYLSFENAVCPEYTTEKFFRMTDLIVPIVLSRAVMPSWIPRDAYIAANEFSSAKDLAYYLHQLAADPNEYKKYFAWTKHYRRAPFEYWHPDNGCQLCAIIHRNEKREIEDFKQYFDTSVCSLGYAEMLAYAPRSIAYRQTLENEEQKLAKYMATNEQKRKVHYD